MIAQTSNEFIPANARFLCRCAAQTYGDITAQDGWTATVLIDTGHLLVAVFRCETDVAIAVRGTKNLPNVLADMDCILKRDGDWKVHEGFSNSVDLVEQAVANVILAEAFGPRRIWLTGHSLGGAMVHLLAARFVRKYRRQPFAGIYTYGQPRVGNAAYRDWYNSSGLQYYTFRVVNQDDIVPRLPWLLGRYRHSAHEIYFTGVQKYFVDLPMPVKLICDVPGLVREVCKDRAEFVEDHHSARYLQILDA